MAQKIDIDMDISFTSSVLSITTSFGALLFGDDLFSYSAQNPDDLVIHLLILLLIYVLIPITFILGSKLFLLLFLIPFDPSRGEIRAVRINRLTKASATMALATLLVGLGIGVYIVCQRLSPLGGSEATRA